MHFLQQKQKQKQLRKLSAYISTLNVFDCQGLLSHPRLNIKKSLESYVNVNYRNFDVLFLMTSQHGYGMLHK